MPLPLKKDDNTWYYRDYRTWPDEERWELIEGVAFDMSPAPSKRHQAISRELEFIIYSYLKEKECSIFDAPFDVFLPESGETIDDITTVVQPDLVIVCDGKKLIDQGCMGAPDIVIEITSPSTGAKDKKEKHALYQKHGVREYWIVEPYDNTVMVFRLDGEDSYGAPLVHTKEDTLETPLFPGLEIALKDVFIDE